jgi:Family of unknown function (DUF5947)
MFPGNGDGTARNALSQKAAGRRRADVVSGLRGLSRAGSGQPSGANGEPDGAIEEQCDLCGTPLPAEHRHLLQLTDRRILCACETCLNERSADPDMRPAGTRVAWIDELAMADELWARLGIPIGLAFFTINGATGETVAFYPSPAGSTECELDLDAWDELKEANPELESLEPDAEAFVVNRLADPPIHVVLPIDECYRMVGTVKAAWEGISGGAEVDAQVANFFDELRERHSV